MSCTSREQGKRRAVRKVSVKKLSRFGWKIKEYECRYIPQ
jgi:hypothetical protein